MDDCFQVIYYKQKLKVEPIITGALGTVPDTFETTGNDSNFKLQECRQDF